MKVLVCGGRDYNNWTALQDFLDGFHLETPITELIHGCAKGADTMAEDWAKLNSIPVRRFRARWDKLGKGAGPTRNQQMLDEAKPDVVIAFPGHAGTANMKSLAKKANVKVIVVEVSNARP